MFRGSILPDLQKERNLGVLRQHFLAPTPPPAQNWKKTFFCDSEVLGSHIWRKKTRKLRQILNRDKLC